MIWNLFVGLIVSLIVGTNAFPAPQANNGIDPGLATTITVRPAYDLVGTNNGLNGFGLGAAAGIGGIGASAGLGSFTVDPKSDPFLPFGAFAGINLPNQAGRIGAGCTGLNCGVQVGELVLQVPNFFSVFTPQNAGLQPQQQNTAFADAVGSPSASDNNGDLGRSGNTTVVTRNDQQIRRPQDQGNVFLQTLLGGLRDFRTTLAGFFREPDTRTSQVQSVPQRVAIIPPRAATTPTPTSTTPSTTTAAQETTTLEVRENEVPAN